MSNDIIATDLQGQYVDSPIVYLYELDLGDGTILYFHPGLDSNLQEVRFYNVGGNFSENTSLATTNSYTALPIMLEGIEANSDGASNRPTLTVANVTSVFRAALDSENFTFEELVGKRITCRRTFEKYLYGGSEQATPFEFPVQRYLIDRVGQETNTSIIFELAAPFDVSGVRIPNRVVVGKYCSWEYQGYDPVTKKSGCYWGKTNRVTYDGVLYQPFFDIDDRPLIQSGLVTFSTWSAVSWSENDFVTYNGLKWRSESDFNEDTPSSDSVNWQEVIEYTTWSSSTSYSINNYVKSDNKIWRSLRNSNLNNTPGYNSAYWTRVDYCSKQLSGCKARFQFIPLNGTSVPAAAKSSLKTLPFGGFPGSVKFK